MATALSLLQNTKFEELCRLCGSKTDMLAVHIFEDEGTFSELVKKIFNCLQLQIHQQDELPKLLCDHCLVKLEMFWDFKNRSFRTEQLLIELYKQLKNGGEQQQCLVGLDSNGMLLQVPNHPLLTDDLPTDIDISQLDRRDSNETSDYAVILNHHGLNAAHLGNLELNNHNLTGQSLQENLVVLPPESDERFAEDNLNLVHQELLNEPQFKMHPELRAVMATDDTVYGNNARHSSSTDLEYSKNRPDKESLGTIDYSDHKRSLVVDSNLSDNSLGVEVDSHFDRMISYSSDSNTNALTDPDISNINGVIDKEEYLLDGDSMERGEGLVVNLQSFESRQGQFLKCEGDVTIPKKEEANGRRVCINYKDEISLDSVGGSFKNEDSNSLVNTPSPVRELTEQNKVLTQSEILERVESIKPEGKVCSECGKSYKTKYKLAEHMTKHTGERPYKCGGCDKAFRSKIGLAQHEAKHTGQYELSCPICGKGFQCRSYLTVHQRVHSDLKPYPCTTCGLNFKTKQSLLDHTNRHLGVKPFSCSICNRGFITKSLCVAHERTHTGVDNRKYTCKICQKRFVSKSYLQTHFRIHTGEKSFICEVCGKGFLTRVDLKIHLTMHTGEKSYVCEMCGKAFARRDALKCHRRCHTGERPYRCDVCGRTFTQFTPMANHRRHHTGDKPFSCETCGKTFVSRSTMVSHQKKKHLKTVGGKRGDADSRDIVKEEVTIEEHPL